MKRLAFRLIRFAWSWRTLKIALWLTTLIVLFYAEEDWRGARVWAATKKKWEARGETFDFTHFIPAPVPNAQNLGALPMLRLKKQKGVGYPLEPDLSRAFDSQHAIDQPPNDWIWGELPDFSKIRQQVSADYVRRFKHASSAGAREQLEEIFPFLVELREAARQRPLCRFDYDNTQEMPAARSLALITGQIPVLRLVSLDAELALEEHRPEIALADGELAARLRQGLEQDPSIIAGLVAGTFMSFNDPVYTGIAQHAWSDDQLAEIERKLASVDYLSIYRFDLRAEAATSVAILDYSKTHLGELKIAMDMSGIDLWPKGSWLASMLRRAYSFCDAHAQWVYGLWPRGWYDLNKAQVIDETLSERQEVDPSAHRFLFQLTTERCEAALKRRGEAAAFLPWNVLATAMAFPVWKHAQGFSLQQSRVDETRIACALERYWLKHHAYPATLDALVPDEIAELPHDLIDGKPYRYRTMPDGGYLLYSLGANGTDEGGQVAYQHQPYDRPGRPNVDIAHGDWVWPRRKSD